MFGYSSFTLNDIIIEQCNDSGVCASGSATVTRCNNIIIRQCEGSGVFEYLEVGQSLLMEQRHHENCTVMKTEDYGLEDNGFSSKIQIISPLTKESISERKGATLL